MILPIRSYGDPVLKKVAQDIEPGHPGLKQLIADMYETMYAASGVGLAAPQIGEVSASSWWTVRPSRRTRTANPRRMRT